MSDLITPISHRQVGKLDLGPVNTYETAIQVSLPNSCLKIKTNPDKSEVLYLILASSFQHEQSVFFIM